MFPHPKSSEPKSLNRSSSAPQQEVARMLTPSAVDMLRPSEDIATTSSSVEEAFAEDFSSCLAEEDLRSNPKNEFAHGLAASHRFAHAHSSLPKALSLNSDAKNRLNYWQAATAKPQKQQRQSSLAPSSASAQSGIPAGPRVPASSRHRLSFDHEAQGSFQLPQAGLRQDSPVKLQESRRDVHSGTSKGQLPFYQSASLSSCDNFNTAVSGPIRESLSLRWTPPLHLSRENSIVEESEYDVSKTNMASCESKAGPAPEVYPVSCCQGSGFTSAYSHVGVGLMSKPAVTRGVYQSGSLYTGPKCHSERICDSRVGALVSQDSLGRGGIPLPRGVALERYHSLQSGDVVPKVDRQRTLSFGGPAVSSPVATTSSSSPGTANVFQWAAQARMQAKGSLSRRSSV